MGGDPRKKSGAQLLGSKGPVWNPVTRHFENEYGETWGSSDYERRRGFTGGSYGYGGGGGSTRWTVPQRITGTTSTTIPIKPDMPLPTFTLPERDVGRVKELRREAISTPMRSMRQEARRALSRIGAMEGPMAKEAYRGWTEGLGTGISSIASQASLQAEQLYGVERAEEIRAMLTNFQAELNQYFASWGQKTTTKYQYGGAGSGSGEEEISYGAFGPSHYVIS